MDQESAKLNEDIKFLRRRVLETTNLLKDGKYIQAYHKNLGVNQKLADLQKKIEEEELVVDCKNNKDVDVASGDRMIKYGDKAQTQETLKEG